MYTHNTKQATMTRKTIKSYNKGYIYAAHRK